jgi:hypothetical protein
LTLLEHTKETYRTGKSMGDSLMRAFQPLAEQERLGHDVDAVHVLPPIPALPRMAVLLRGSVVDTYAW